MCLLHELLQFFFRLEVEQSLAVFHDELGVSFDERFVATLAVEVRHRTVALQLDLDGEHGADIVCRATNRKVFFRRKRKWSEWRNKAIGSFQKQLLNMK